MLTGGGAIFAKEDCRSGTRAVLRKRTSQGHFSKNGVAEAELREDVSLEWNCGSGTSQRQTFRAELRKRNFVRHYPQS